MLVMCFAIATTAAVMGPGIVGSFDIDNAVLIAAQFVERARSCLSSCAVREVYDPRDGSNVDILFYLEGLGEAYYSIG